MKIRFAVCLVFMLFMPAAHAASQFNVKCSFDHTLPDDPIIHPGAPGQAMLHDFFGNTGTDAYSTYSSLNSNKVTSCDASSDPSAYWVPSLKRASGTIVPSYQKTYYKNDQPVVTVSPIPAGLEMLAGNHMGTQPNPHVNFLCRGMNYTTTAPTNCRVYTDSTGTYSQLDISVHFPDCWDGKTLAPVLGITPAKMDRSLMAAANGQLNVAYRNSDGICPSGYPVKIPELQLNAAYALGQDPDLSTAQLSLDPVLVNGQWVQQWGSLYTAHGDFIGVWKADIMKYLIDTCMNQTGLPGSTCDNNIPTYYSAATANVQLDSSGTPQPQGTTLVSAPGNVVLMKFPMPSNLNDYPYAHSYVQTLGGNITSSSSAYLNLYAATTSWDDNTQLPTNASCTTQSIGAIYLNNVMQVRTNDISSYIASQKAAGATQIGVCIRNTTTSTVSFSSRTGNWIPALYLK